MMWKKIFNYDEKSRSRQFQKGRVCLIQAIKKKEKKKRNFLKKIRKHKINIQMNKKVVKK